MNRVAKILFPVNVPEAFDYEIPEGVKLSRGDFVYAPIGKQVKLGVVWGLAAASDKKLKPVAERKACRGLTPEIMKFVDFTARYNCASLGMVLRMVMRSYKALEPSPMVSRFTPTSDSAP